MITGIAAASDALYIRRMAGGISDLLRLEHSPGAKPAPVKLPFDGDIDALAADPRLPGVVFETGAWTRFGGYYAYDPKAAKVVDTKLQPQGRYDNPGRPRLDRGEGEIARRHARAVVDRAQEGA